MCEMSFGLKIYFLLQFERQTFMKCIADGDGTGTCLGCSMWAELVQGYFCSAVLIVRHAGNNEQVATSKGLASWTWGKNKGILKEIFEKNRTKLLCWALWNLPLMIAFSRAACLVVFDDNVS